MFGFSTFYSYLFLILTLFIILKDINSYKTRNSYFLGFISFCLIVVAAGRSETVGGDLRNYLPHFQAIKDVDKLVDLIFFNGYEPGYNLLTKFISIISPNIHFYIVVTALLSLLGPFFIIRRYSPMPYLSVLLYIGLGFYTNTFNNVRQSIAISLVLFSIKYVQQRNLIKFLICIFVATTIHFSAIFFSVAYILYSLKLDRKKSFLLFCLIPIIIISGNLLIDSIIPLMFPKFNVDREMVPTLISGTGYSLLFLYIVLALMLSFWFYHRKRTTKISPQQNFLMWCMHFVLIFQAFATQMASLTRLTIYFYIPVVVIFIPDIIQTIKSNNRSFVICCVWFLVFLYFNCLTLRILPDSYTNSQAVIPYVFID